LIIQLCPDASMQQELPWCLRLKTLHAWRTFYQSLVAMPCTSVSPRFWWPELRSYCLM